MTAPLRRSHLATIAASLRVGALDAGDATRLATVLDLIAEGVAPDVALGLKLRPGEHHSREQIAARDGILREAAARFWPGEQATDQARHLCKAMRDYHRTRWQRREASMAQNPHPAGTLHGYLWRALRLRDREIGERQMLRILTCARAFNVADRAADCDHLEPE